MVEQRQRKSKKERSTLSKKGKANRIEGSNLEK
jgi:hypothetical protein